MANANGGVVDFGAAAAARQQTADPLDFGDPRVKRFVAARGGDGFVKAKAKSEQLQLLFDEIGE